MGGNTIPANQHHHCVLYPTGRRIAKNFGMTVDDVIYFDEKNGIPNEISMEDKATLEQLQLINKLNDEEKNILLKLIETFVSKKRLKDYLQKNIDTL